MFAAFEGQYQPDNDPDGFNPESPLLALGLRGVSEFFAQFSGVSFNQGLYRTCRLDAIAEWNARVSSAFPELSPRICTFGYDWLGRFFALDDGRRENGEPLVLLIEPGTGEYLEVPATFVSFHNDELLNMSDAALASEFFSEWISMGRPQIEVDKCAGYKVPLFLGGEDSNENLEIIDLAVYWDIQSQLINKVRGLPPGTPIGDITIE